MATTKRARVRLNAGQERALALMQEGPSADVLTEAEVDALRTKPGKAAKYLRRLTLELREWASDDSSFAKNRVALLRKTIKLVGKFMANTQEDVEVYVPNYDPNGNPFKINDREFPPGRHVVKSSVAQTLLEMMDRSRTREEGLYKPVSHTAKLGEIGSHARTVARVHTGTGRGAGGLHIER